MIEGAVTPLFAPKSGPADAASQAMAVQSADGLWQAMLTDRGVRLEPLRRTDAVLPPARGADALVAVIDPADTAALTALAARAAQPNLPPVIAVVPGLTVPLMRMMLQAGAIDAVPLPPMIADIEQAMTQLRGRAVKDTSAFGRLVAFMGTGGSGSTTLAINTAVELAARHRVCVIDLDLQRGTIALQLDLRPTLTLQDLLAAGHGIDATAFAAVATAHASGISLIASPADILPPNEITAEAIERIVDIARRLFAIVIVDLPADWSEWKLHLVERASQICLVTLMDVPGVYRAGRMLAFMAEMDLGGRAELVANRVERSMFREASLTEQENALGRKYAYSIAGDDAALALAAAQGKPLANVRTGSRTLKDIKQLAIGIEAAIAPQSIAASTS